MTKCFPFGSANANPRGFFTDTEVNFVLDDGTTVRDFRERLWAHNLGLPVTEVAKWNLGDFFTRWDAVAKRNAAQPKPEKVVGEGVIPFLPWDKKDKRYQEGKRGPVLSFDQPEGVF
jgi:phosphatidylserine/phosphatidylglycerophosphate/cardiolipin synthase-like enzyme